MSPTESVLIVSKKAYDAIVSTATDGAVRSFMANLGDSSCPSKDELRSAISAARGSLSQSLFDRGTIDILSGEKPIDGPRVNAIELTFSRLAPPLESPPLPAFTELDVIRLALAALLGSVLGALMGSIVGIYLLDMRDAGLLIGAPIGAFAMTWGIEQASRNPWISRTMIGAFGVATVAEVWAFLSVNPLAAIWRKLSGRDSVKRIAVYLLVIGLLIFTRRRVTYDRAILERSVRQEIEGWLHGAILVLAVVIRDQTGSPEFARSNKDAMAELGKRIMELNASSAENQTGLIHDVVEAAKSAGFEGFASVNGSRNGDSRSVLTWVESMRERYDSFGFVEDGDKVFVEQEPVVQSGELLKKGLVRKQRGN